MICAALLAGNDMVYLQMLLFKMGIASSTVAALFTVQAFSVIE